MPLSEESAVQAFYLNRHPGTMRLSGPIPDVVFAGVICRHTAINMKIVIAATNAFAKWLQLDLPRLPTPAGKQPGVQPLVTDTHSLAWQCHAIADNRRPTYRTVIAVEAYSRYTIIIPGMEPVTQQEFEEVLGMRWASELAHLMVRSSALTDKEVPSVYDQFLGTQKHYQWVNNSDLSVGGHANDAAQWVRQAWEEIHPAEFDDEEAFALGMHINTMSKRAKHQGKKGKSFSPAARFVDDGLYRFAKGLSEFSFPQTPHGDFPNPYLRIRSVDVSQPLPNNVISMDSYRRNRN